jgi:hypothetical protein
LREQRSSASFSFFFAASPGRESLGSFGKSGGNNLKSLMVFGHW